MLPGRPDSLITHRRLYLYLCIAFKLHLSAENVVGHMAHDVEVTTVGGDALIATFAGPAKARNSSICFLPLR